MRHDARTMKDFVNKKVTDKLIENTKKTRNVTYQFIAFENGNTYLVPSEPSPACGAYDGRVRLELLKIDQSAIYLLFQIFLF